LPGNKSILPAIITAENKGIKKAVIRAQGNRLLNFPAFPGSRISRVKNMENAR
jgi:hypothetical protein